MKILIVGNQEHDALERLKAMLKQKYNDPEIVFVEYYKAGDEVKVEPQVFPITLPPHYIDNEVARPIIIRKSDNQPWKKKWKR